ncbi:MAG: ABC transporter permease [Planctomycetia bacterium]|nr:ABC transporter permease [Planctomycetia bacterium]
MTVNFGLGMVGLGISIFIGCFLFGVPMRGNPLILVGGSSLYLIVSLSIGLLISSLTKNQFLAVSCTIITTFLPSYLLSGFLFEIKSMPGFLQVLTRFIPARYYVDFLQTSFLVGDVWPNIIKNLLLPFFSYWRRSKTRNGFRAKIFWGSCRKLPRFVSCSRHLNFIFSFPFANLKLFRLFPFQIRKISRPGFPEKVVF